MVRTLLLSLILVANAAFVSAQAYERVLVPTAISGEIPGAFGSRWTTELIIRNDTDEYIEVTQIPGGICAGECPLSAAQPRTTATFQLSIRFPGTGGFLYVAKPNDRRLSFNLRVQDLSRQALTWGTEIPIVREADARTDVIELLNVPTDLRFRQMLRIYDFDGQNGKRARVRIFDQTNDSELASTIVTLSPGPTNDPTLNMYPELPGYEQIGSLADVFPQLAVTSKVRLTIEPIDPGLRFWAFVSVTNNETQHVTTITPQ